MNPLALSLALALLLTGDGLEAKDDPAPADPTGFAPYVDVYGIDEAVTLQTQAVNPTKAGTYGELRFKQGEDDDAGRTVGFFYGEKPAGKPKEKKPKTELSLKGGTGVSIDMRAMFHERVKDSLAYFEKKKADAAKKLAAIKSMSADPDGFKKASLELSTAKVRISRIKRELAGEGDLDKQIARASKLTSELLGLAMGACPNAAKKIDEVYECRGQPAKELSAKLEEVRKYDESLRDTPQHGLQIGALFGESKLEAGGQGYLFQNYLMSLYGVKSFGCYPKGTSGDTFCQVMTDKMEKDHVAELRESFQKKLIEAQMKQTEESELRDPKAAPAATAEELRKANETSDKAAEELKNTLGSKKDAGK